jgi:hypothetical protein
MDNTRRVDNLSQCYTNTFICSIVIGASSSQNKCDATTGDTVSTTAPSSDINADIQSRSTSRHGIYWYQERCVYYQSCLVGYTMQHLCMTLYPALSTSYSGLLCLSLPLYDVEHLFTR